MDKEKNMKTLLLCASHNDLGLIHGLKKLGAQIVVTGAISGQIGEKYCDKYIQADYSDRELILQIAKEEQVDYICACCNDYGVYTAAYVAEQLGLPGYDSYDVTCTLHNKDKFKRFAKENDISTPRAETFNNPDDALAFLKDVKYPVIIKPTDCSAGNGITKIDSYTQAPDAISYAFEKSRAGVVIVEQYVKGTQHGFCTFLVNQKVRAYISNNEYSIMNPYRVEIDTFPADNSDVAAPILISQIEKIASLLQLKDGIFHLQYIMQDDIPVIIEVMRRAVGNMYSVPGDWSTGVAWEYWEVMARCGMSCEAFPENVKQKGFFAYKAILGEKNGTIEKITIPKEYDDYLISSCIVKERGVITHYQSEPIGFLFFEFQSQEEMESVLIKNYRTDLVTVRD